MTRTDSLSERKIPMSPPTAPPVTTVWSYGVTTIPSRRDTLLGPTLRSLDAAGFSSPRLFVDGDEGPREWKDWANQELGLNIEVTCRWPKLRPFGNWAMALVELYLRSPDADRYIVFQDDLVTYRGLREYLEAIPLVENEYYNLYSFPENEVLRPQGHVGWYPSNQKGKGALALMFSGEAARTLLQHKEMVGRPRNVGCNDRFRNWRHLDGGVLHAMNKAGYREMVHAPGLVQHTGKFSSVDKRATALGWQEKFPVYRWTQSFQSKSFRGEHFDARDLLGEKAI